MVFSIMCLSLFYKKISDLNGELILNEISIADLKKMAEILVIDDQEFDYLNDLQKYDFKIRKINDITALSDVEAYPIVLCDIRGVGKFLNSKYDGANLINQLRVKYPDKIIIAYTAESYEADFEPFLSNADEVIAKGTCSIESWASLLEKYVKGLADPVKQWERTRKKLFAAGVSTVEVAKYESEYVKAINNGSFESFKKLYGAKKPGSNIIIELASSTFAKIITHKKY